MNTSLCRVFARFSSLVLLTASAAALVVSPAARADVKVVSRVTVSGASGAMANQVPSGPQSQTSYYKGAKIRTESDNGGRVMIYDTQTKTLTILNPARKTYTSVPVSEMAQNPMLGMLDIKTSSTVKSGGKTKTIAGKPAKNYLWTATMAMGLKPGAMPPGKAPGGGAAAPKMPTGTLVSIKMDGEQWTTEAVKMPGSTGKGMLAVFSGPAAAIPGLQPLLDKMSTVKGVPLTSTIHQTMTRGAGFLGGGGANGATLPTRAMTTQVDVVSLAEAPLPDSLFSVPAGYTKVTVPRGGGGIGPMGM